MIRRIFLTVAALMLSIDAGAQCESIYDSDLHNMTWNAHTDSRYTLCYGPEFVDDLALASRWIDNAFQIAQSKYYVVPPVQRRGRSISITIYLVPVPTSRANSHTATVMCCSDSVSLEIHIMSPSAPEYGQDADHFIKTLTHEMMNTLHYEAREPPNISPSRWILEGLAEYEGYCNTTTANEAKLNWLIEYVYDNDRDEVFFGQSLLDSEFTIISGDRYRGSAMVVYFLGEFLGEDSHYQLFQGSLNDLFWSNRIEPRWVFQSLAYWLQMKYREVEAGEQLTCP